MDENKVSFDTILRTVILGITLINQILTSTGKNPLPFSEDTLYELLTVLATVGVSIWSWWKNNSFTQEAIEADKLMNKLKGEKTDEPS